MNEHEETAAALAPAAAAVRALRVEVCEGPDAGASFAGRPGAPVSVGSAADNDLRINDAHASRYHLDLTPTASGIRIEDLGSRNGTFSGGLRIDRAVGRPGVRLRLGSTVLELHDDFGGPSPASSAIELDGFVAKSGAMRAVLADAHRLATSDVSVLVRGETGWHGAC